MKSDAKMLLAAYANSGSEPAYREVVTRYLDLVYSTALRVVEGDAHLAQDVAQTVFLDLARKAGSLAGEVMLGGWLHQHARNVALTSMRGERRRQARERQAAEMNALEDHTESNLAQLAPVLDDAIGQLEADDRTAILLRFFEQYNLLSVGEALGTSEDAARKRVTRALDKLQVLLKHRGVSLSAAALGTILATEAVSAAPAGLALSIANSVLANVAVGGFTLELLKLKVMTKILAGLFLAVAVIGIGTSLWLLRSRQELRDENQTLLLQGARLDHLQLENERLSNLVVLSDQKRLPNDQFAELLRLRGEVTQMRQAQAAAALSPRMQTPAPPFQLKGIASFGTVRLALLQEKASPPRLREVLFAEGQHDADVEVLTIDPSFATVEVRNAGQTMQLAFVDDALPPGGVIAAKGAPPGAPAFLRLQKAGWRLVFDLYQRLAHRNLIGPSSWPNFELDLAVLDAATEADLARAIEQALAKKGIVIRLEGEKFALASRGDEFNALLPPLRELASTIAKSSRVSQGASEEVMPEGTIDFAPAELNQVLAIYAALTDRTILQAVALPIVSLRFRSSTSLTRADSIFALAALLAANGVSILPAGDKLLIAVPAGDTNQVSAVLARKGPAQAVAGSDLPAGKLNFAAATIQQVIKTYSC
jgi:RNA polymerase sigma factor (sigma-70 family)